MDLNLFKNKIRRLDILTVNGVEYNSANIVGGITYKQTVNSGTDIVLGSCTCSTIEFELMNLNNLINNLAGKEITWKKRVESSPGVFEDIQMGYFIAEKPTKVNDTRIRVKAYDRMKKFDVEVDDWLRTVSYPITLKNFLLSLCSYVGVTLSNTTFLNDNFQVKFNFMGTNVKGRDVLKWITEIAAKFAVITELGELKLGWYNNIVYGVNNSNYYNVKVEDYLVKKIDKLQVRVEENDIGVVVGTGTNAYVIQNNPLLYAASDAEIRPYVELIYNAIKDFTYAPYEIKVNDNPLIKAGNMFDVTTRKGQVFKAVVMSRTMTIGSDVYSATGNMDRSINTSVNTIIKQLRGKSNVLERTLEQTVSRLFDADTGELTQIIQTVNSFNTRVQTIESNMNFRYQQDTPPENPEIGDIWLNTNPNGFIVDLLTMLVDEMLQPVDYYSSTLNKSYRWTGSQWEHVEDGAITELRMNVSEIDQTVDAIGLTVQTYDGRIGSLELTANTLTSRIATAEGDLSEIIQTANSLTSRIVSTEGNVSTLQQTATSLTSRIANTEGSVSSLQQTANSIQSQVSSINSTVGSHTSSIIQLSNEISSVVSFTDVTGYQISSKITQSASAINLLASNITLDADQIDLNGITNVNRYLTIGKSGDRTGSIQFTGAGSIEFSSVSEGISLSAWQITMDAIRTYFMGHAEFESTVSFLDADVEGIVACYYPTNWFYLDYGGGSKITVRSKSGSLVGYLNIT